jgi:hypothetical protein
MMAREAKRTNFSNKRGKGAYKGAKKRYTRAELVVTLGLQQLLQLFALKASDTALKDQKT